MLVAQRQPGFRSPQVPMDQGYGSDSTPSPRHLVQSPYNVPVLPPLRDRMSPQMAPPANFASPPISPRTGKTLPEPYYPPHLGAGRTISPPMPLREWPYVLPTDPSQAPAFPTNTARHDYQPDAAPFHAGAAHEPYQPEPLAYQDKERKASDGTTLSSTTGDEQDKDSKKRKKKRSSKISSKVKSAVKDLFTRDDKDESVSTVKRESDPWYDEDY